MFLMVMYPAFSENIDLDDYMKMIASYVLFVNSFNTFCNVRMQKGWNGSIHNEYVSKIINVLPNGVK